MNVMRGTTVLFALQAQERPELAIFGSRPGETGEGETIRAQPSLRPAHTPGVVGGMGCAEWVAWADAALRVRSRWGLGVRLGLRRRAQAARGRRW